MALAAAGRRVGKQLGIAPIACAAQKWIHMGGAAGQQSQQPKAVAMSKLKDSFLDGTSSTYLEELEERYRSDPQSVDKTWGSFFKSLGTSCLCNVIINSCSHCCWTRGMV